jgi:hypothetical protein
MCCKNTTRSNMSKLLSATASAFVPRPATTAATTAPAAASAVAPATSQPADQPRAPVKTAKPAVRKPRPRRRPPAAAAASDKSQPRIVKPVIEQKVDFPKSEIKLQVAKRVPKPHSRLAQEIAEKLTRDEYECAICYERLGRRAKIWSCEKCFMILHLSCVRTWSLSGPNGHDILTRKWLCPGCLHQKEDVPSVYTCFCGNTVDPPFNSYLTPHCCSMTCGKSRAAECPHPCNLPCHPGSCPPCPALGSLKHCPCKAISYRLRCGEEESKPRVCDGPCNALLSCNNHRCPQKARRRAHTLITCARACMPRRCRIHRRPPTDG